MPQPDFIAILEAAYRVEADEVTWLSRVRDAAAPALDRGLGVSAFCYDARDPSRLRLRSFLGNDRGGRIVRAIQQSAPHRVRWVFRTQACRAASEGPDWNTQPAAKLFRSLGFEDVLFVNGVDPTGRGCFLTAKQEKKRRPSRATAAVWSFVGAHLAAGYRLQRSAMARSSRSRLDRAAAVMTPRGRIEHASAEVAASRVLREVLRDAAIAMDRSRGRARRTEQEAALAAWTPLVEARWSLLDHFDHDGRRYVVACSNDAAPRTPAALTPREREVLPYAALGHANKLIAYELGITASTVGVLFSRAAKKLGATSRTGGIEAYRRLTDPTFTRDT